VAAFVVGTGYLALSDRGPSSDLGRWAGQATPAAGQAAGDPFGQATTALAGAPSRLRIKAIDLDTPLEKLHLGAGGALVPPGGYGEAGWYAAGTAPGDIGPAVIAGHVDSKSGAAIFYRLRELTVGDRIEVVRGGKVVRFTVTRTAWYPKTRFPTEEVYGPTPDRQLRLITCGGVFDHRLRSYTDNLVVYAVAG
jgi:LPXTG-site transpeptidase (sortase) family protein